MAYPYPIPLIGSSMQEDAEGCRGCSGAKSAAAKPAAVKTVATKPTAAKPAAAKPTASKAEYCRPVQTIADQGRL